MAHLWYPFGTIRRFRHSAKIRVTATNRRASMSPSVLSCVDGILVPSDKDPRDTRTAILIAVITDRTVWVLSSRNFSSSKVSRLASAAYRKRIDISLMESRSIKSNLAKHSFLEIDWIADRMEVEQSRELSRLLERCLKASTEVTRDRLDKALLLLLEAILPSEIDDKDNCCRAIHWKNSVSRT